MYYSIGQANQVPSTELSPEEISGKEASQLYPHIQPYSVSKCVTKSSPFTAVTFATKGLGTIPENQMVNFLGILGWQLAYNRKCLEETVAEIKKKEAERAEKYRKEQSDLREKAVKSKAAAGDTLSKAKIPLSLMDQCQRKVFPGMPPCPPGMLCTQSMPSPIISYDQSCIQALTKLSREDIQAKLLYQEAHKLQSKLNYLKGAERSAALAQISRLQSQAATLQDKSRNAPRNKRIIIGLGATAIAAALLSKFWKK